jgi:hypothetical protein
MVTNVRSLYIIRQGRKADSIAIRSNDKILFENGGLSSIARILGIILIVSFIQ